MISCHGPAVDCGSTSGLGTQLGDDCAKKEFLYLQDRDWAVRIICIELGDVPSCTTLFLWFNMVQRTVNNFWRYSIETSSFRLCLLRMRLKHCWMEVLWKSEACMARVEPCQQALAKEQRRNKWVEVSSSSLQRGQVVVTGIPLWLKLEKVGRLSCSNFQTKLFTLSGTYTFQTLAQTTWFS